MAKLTLYQFILVSIIQFAFALSATGQITGRILDAAGQPLSFCQVGLVKATDSTIVNTAVTDSKGKFAIEVKDSGTFRVLASYIGYKTFYSSVFSISKSAKQYDVGSITLTSESKILNNVDVIAQKPFVEYKTDRTVYNIENSIIASGNNVLEVLKKLPGVTIDNKDNISVGGTSGVLIMVDGRTSYLSAADAADYLRTLDASQVEKIEIISPSAKYDASGGTVINIVRKRNKNAGLYAEINSSYEQGIYGGGKEGINLNYNTKKWNLFADYNYNFNQFMKYFGGTTNFITNSAIQNIFADSLQRKESNWANSGRLEADFLPDKNQTIAFVVEGSQKNGIVDKDFPTRMYDANSRLDSSLTMRGHRSYSTINMSYGLNYNLKIDSLGKELSADINYANYSSHFSELDVTSYYDSLNDGVRTPTILQYSLPRIINIWAAEINYDQPLGKNGKLETGLKGSYVSTDNNAQYWNVVNGIYSTDTAFTNDFTYTEYIYAGYINYIQKVNKRLDFQCGLRGEETRSKGVQSVHDTSFTHNYFNLFPNILITYKLDTNNVLKLRYRRRIWRPSYQDLNPFIYIINPYAYQEGNPALQPQISNSMSIAEVYKNILNIEVGDEYWTDPVSYITVQNNQTFIIYSLPQNFRNFNNIFGKIEAPLPVAKWFTSSNTLIFMQQQYEGSIQGAYFAMSQFTWTYDMVNMITLNKTWSCELDFNYSAKQLDGPELYNPVYVVEAGVKKNFAKDRGTVALNCSDIFWSDRYIGSEVFQNENFREYEYNDTRRLRLSLSWKFGKPAQEQKEKDKAAQDELNRIKD